MHARDATMQTAGMLRFCFSALAPARDGAIAHALPKGCAVCAQSAAAPHGGRDVASPSACAAAACALLLPSAAAGRRCPLRGAAAAPPPRRGMPALALPPPASRDKAHQSNLLCRRDVSVPTALRLRCVARACDCADSSAAAAVLRGGQVVSHMCGVTVAACVRCERASSRGAAIAVFLSPSALVVPLFLPPPRGAQQNAKTAAQAR
jgi:hypothetical protein